MKIDFKKTLDSAKRNITKATIARSTARHWDTIHNYYTETTRIPLGVNKKLIEIFEDNGDEIFFKED